MSSLVTEQPSRGEMSPDALPLDRRTYAFNRNGIKDQIPALHKLWANLSREWVPYRPPPYTEEELSIPGATETWCERSLFVIDDLDHLLSLPHHKVSLNAFFGVDKLNRS